MSKKWMAYVCLAMMMICMATAGSSIAESSITKTGLPGGQIPDFIRFIEDEEEEETEEYDSFDSEDYEEEEYEDDEPTLKPMSVQLRGYDKKSKTYQYVYFGKYEQTRGGQPILWRVLAVEGSDALLLSEKILAVMPFGYDNVWEDSDIKEWLNSDFLDEAFSRKEEGAIYESSMLGKVFLLSEEEVLNPEYGFKSNGQHKDNNRAAKGTTIAIENGLDVISKNRNSGYFTRTAPNRSNVRGITSEGKCMLVSPDREDLGVRPAIWVNLDEVEFYEGDGTMEYPYQ